MNNGIFENKRLVSEKAILERRLPQIKIGEKSAYGLGLFLSHEQGLNIFGHGGNTFGFSSELFFIPEEIGMVILTNSFSANSFLAAVKQKFFELAFTVNSRPEEIVSFAAQERAATIKKNLKSISVAAQDMKCIGALCGKYYSDHTVG